MVCEYQAGLVVVATRIGGAVGYGMLEAHCLIRVRGIQEYKTKFVFLCDAVK